MSSTKKVKSAGRYGARYGIGIRRRLLKMEEQQKKPINCPNCGFSKVKRKAPGIFVCLKCNSKLAGGAFALQTLTGSIVSKMVSQKSFLPSLTELLQATEASKGSALEKKEETEKIKEEEHKHKQKE